MDKQNISSLEGSDSGQARPMPKNVKNWLTANLLKLNVFNFKFIRLSYQMEINLPAKCPTGAEIDT
jgi:hypothetical protein